MNLYKELLAVVMVIEFLLGVQTWWKSKSLIALGLVGIGFVLGLAISPFTKLFNKGENK